MTASIAIIELSSIATGFQVQDAVIKAANVQILVARTVCPGKFIIVFGGNVANVQASLKAGELSASGFLVDQLLIPNVDKRIFPALSGTVDLPEKGCKTLGIIETFSSPPIIQAADAAVKAASVVLFRVHLAMATGGKGYLLLCGDVGAVKTAVHAGVESIRSEGILVNQTVITGASRQLFQECI